MDREQAKELQDAFNAFANGFEIEFQSAYGRWLPATEPTWNPDIKYRKKPKAREWWLDPTDGEVLQQDNPPNSDFIKVREILD